MTNDYIHWCGGGGAWVRGEGGGQGSGERGGGGRGQGGGGGGQEAGVRVQVAGFPSRGVGLMAFRVYVS